MKPLWIIPSLIWGLLAHACIGPPRTPAAIPLDDASTDEAPPPEDAGDPGGAAARQAEAGGDPGGVADSEPRGSGEWVENTAPETDADDASAMPPELLEDNFQTTQYTALVRITAARVEDPHPESGYVNHVYRARVMETFRGDSLDIIEYRAMADRGAALFLPAYPVIVSLCGASPEKGFYVPDNGYVTAAATPC